MTGTRRFRPVSGFLVRRSFTTRGRDRPGAVYDVKDPLDRTVLASEPEVWDGGSPRETETRGWE